MVLMELPTEQRSADPDIRIWGRCSVRHDGELLHVDRAGHPSVSSFFNTDDTRRIQRQQAIHDPQGAGSSSSSTCSDTLAIHMTRRSRRSTTSILPDTADLQPGQAGQISNGRVFTDDVIDYRLASLTKGDCPPSEASPRTTTPRRVRISAPAALRFRSGRRQPVVDLKPVAARHDGRAAVAGVVRRDDGGASARGFGEDAPAGDGRGVGVDVECARVRRPRDLDRAVVRSPTNTAGWPASRATAPRIPVCAPVPTATQAIR